MSIRRQRGVTLIELVVVMVIVAILAAIAIPGYRKQIIRTNRTSAKTMLTQTAQNLERCFTRTQTYAGCLVLPLATPDGTYQVNFDPAPPAGFVSVDNTGFTLLAVPQGTQATDAKCGTFRLSHRGDRLVTGTAPATECWGR